MFSSKTLEARNSDPSPWTDGTDSRSDYRSGSWDVFDPRPEFQHGSVPANRILLEFRDVFPRIHRLGIQTAGELAENWLGYWYSPWFFETQSTLAERAHAHRVLSLLASLPSEVKA